MTIAGVVLYPVGALPAFAATSVTAVTVVVNPTTAGAGTATYTIHFTTSASGSLAGGKQITIIAPDGTALPSYASGYTITATAGSVPIGAVATAQVVGPGSASTSATYNQVVITLGGSSSSTPIANNDTVALMIHPTGNPIMASTADHVTVSTSTDATAAQSAAYTITPGPAASFITPQGDYQSAAAGTPGTTFPKQFGVTLVDAYGNPIQGAAVTFTAPASSVTQPAASGTFDHVTSSACSTTSPSNPPPANVCVATTDNSGKVTASPFTTNSTAGNYLVTAMSTGVPTYSFHVTNCAGACPSPPTAVSPGSVSVAPATAGATGATYRISFTTTASGPGSNGSIKFVAPSGTAFSSQAADYSISVSNLSLAFINSVSATATGGSATPNQVVINLGLSTIGAGTVVTVQILKSSSGVGVTNPTKAGVNYQIQESTSADTLAGVYTSTYSIVAGNPGAVSIVSGDNQSGLIENSFANPLVAAAKDQFGNGVAGAQVTFTTPSTGPSAAWTNGTTVETDTTTSTGQAESSVPVANSTAGGPYSVTAAANASFNATPATFHLTNYAQHVNPSVPSLTSAKAGDQNVGYSLTFTTSSTGALGTGGTISVEAPSGTNFTSSKPTDYSIAVTGGHTAVVGQVTASSTSGSPTSNQVVVALSSSTISSGDAVTLNIGSVTNPTAVSDTYAITEWTSSDSVQATTPDYSITAADPASVTLVSGTGQTVETGHQFAQPLVVVVHDAFGNPVPGAAITFSGPATGAGALFANSMTSETDTTDANGLATSSIPTANGTAGTYSVSAVDAAFNVSANPTFLLHNVVPAWSGWIGPQTGPLPGMATPPAAPAVASWQPGRLDVFIEGGDASLWHRASTDGGVSWSAWEDLGGVLADSPSAVSWAPGRLDVFVRGSDNQMWHKWFDGGAWSGWESLGGVLASAPAVSSWAPGRLDVFVQGGDGGVWHRWWDGQSWNVWESLGGIGRFAPAAVSWGPNHIDLFTVGGDGGMWSQYFDQGSWSGWFKPVSGTFATGPGVSSWGVGRLDLFAVSTEPGNPMTHFIFDGTWHTESLGGQPASAPAVVSWGPQRIDMFVQFTDQNLWYQWFGFQ